MLREILDGTDCSWPDASPGLVTLQEVGELQGKRHALFEWVPGVTLRDALEALEQRGSAVPLGLVGRAVLSAARALAGVKPLRAHGGLSDAAIQLGFDGRVSVLDWGAPRQSRFRPLGRVNYSSDVFALGGVLHAALTGFRGEYATAPSTLPGLSTSHPEATPALDEVVTRALSPQPDGRQHDVGALADELEAVLGERLFTQLQVADLVQELFRERIKLLQSLGGLTDAHPAESLEAVLPIPTGTQPGAPPIRALVEPPSEPTLPRVEQKELKPWDSAEVPPLEPPSDPTLPRVLSSEVVRKVPAAPAKPATSQEETAPRARPAVGEQVEPTLPRAPAPAPPLEDTRPRTPRPELEDTAPRARVVDPDPPDAPARPRNTTEHERHRARGQERVQTPPQGAVAVLGDEPAGLDEPTAVRSRPKPPGAASSETGPALAPARKPRPARPVDEDEAPPPPPSRTGLWGVIVVLLLVVAGLAVAVVLKAQRGEEPPPELPALAELEVDAGDEPEDAGLEAPDAGFDAGATEADAGEADAGWDDAGVVDAGSPPDAGAKEPAKKPGKKPVKKAVKKKKRR